MISAATDRDKTHFVSKRFTPIIACILVLKDVSDAPIPVNSVVTVELVLMLARVCSMSLYQIFLGVVSHVEIIRD